MFVVKNSDNPGTNIGKYFTEWEAKEAADDLNRTLNTTVYFVDKK